MFFILAQILAVVAFILDIICMQFKKKSGILVVGIISNTMYALEYALLGAWTGAISFVIGTIRNITYFIYEKKKYKPNKIVLAIFVLLIIGAGIYTWENITSLLPVIALVLWTIVSWQNNTKWMRLAEAFICVMWIIYDLFVGAYAGIITEFIILFSFNFLYFKLLFFSFSFISSIKLYISSNSILSIHDSSIKHPSFYT